MPRRPLFVSQRRCSRLLAAAPLLVGCLSLLGAGVARAQYTDALAGVDALSAFTSTRIGNAQRFTRAVANRFTASRYELRTGRTDAHGLVPGAFAPAPPRDSTLFGMGWPSTAPGTPLGPTLFDFSPGRNKAGYGSWIDANLSFTSLDGGPTAESIDANVYGISAGLDLHLSPHPSPALANLRMGAAVGFDYSTFDAHPSPTAGWASTVHGAIFASYTLSRFYVGTVGRFGYTSLRTRRILVFSLPPARADGTTDGAEASGYVEVGALFGDPESVAIQPTASFDYTWIGQNGFHEQNAQSLALTVADTSTASMSTTLGIRLMRQFPFDTSLFGEGPEGEFGMEPELRAAWSYEFGDRGRHILVRQSSGQLVRAAGAEASRNSFLVGVGYTMRFHRIALIALDYDCRFDFDGRIDNLLKLGLIFHW